MLVYLLPNFVVLFRSFKSRILDMLPFFCYFLPILLGNQSLTICFILVREGPLLFLFSILSGFVTRFTWFSFSWVVSPIWALVI